MIMRPAANGPPRNLVPPKPNGPPRPAIRPTLPVMNNARP